MDRRLLLFWVLCVVEVCDCSLGTTACCGAQRCSMIAQRWLHDLAISSGVFEAYVIALPSSEGQYLSDYNQAW